MSTIINATTTNGVVIQPDNSGSLVLQTNSGTTALTIDTSQRAAFVAGTAALPAITTTGDTNTGMFFPAADTIAFAEGGTEAMRLDSDGNILVGTTTASGKITILQSSNGLALNIGNESNIDGGYYGAVQITRPGNQTGNAFHLAFVRNGNKIAGMGFLDNSNTLAIQNANDNTGAGVTLTSGATSWGTTSDERKKDIVGNVEDALSKISDWRCVYYKYKSDEQNTQQRVGLIAQDVQKTLPEAISIEEDELQTLQLRYTETIPVLVKAIQEQQTIINDLKARIETLEAK